MGRTGEPEREPVHGIEAPAVRLREQRKARVDSIGPLRDLTLQPATPGGQCEREHDKAVVEPQGPWLGVREHEAQRDDERDEPHRSRKRDRQHRWQDLPANPAAAAAGLPIVNPVPD